MSAPAGEVDIKIGEYSGTVRGGVGHVMYEPCTSTWYSFYGWVRMARQVVRANGQFSFRFAHVTSGTASTGLPSRGRRFRFWQKSVCAENREGGPHKFTSRAKHRGNFTFRFPTSFYQLNNNSTQPTIQTQP